MAIRENFLRHLVQASLRTSNLEDLFVSQERTMGPRSEFTEQSRFKVGLLNEYTTT